MNHQPLNLITEDVTATMQMRLAEKTAPECANGSGCKTQGCNRLHPANCYAGITCADIKDADHCAKYWHGPCPMGKACRNSAPLHINARHARLCRRGEMCDNDNCDFIHPNGKNQAPRDVPAAKPAQLPPSADLRATKVREQKPRADDVPVRPRAVPAPAQAQRPAVPKNIRFEKAETPGDASRILLSNKQAVLVRQARNPPVETFNKTIKVALKNLIGNERSTDADSRAAWVGVLAEYGIKIHANMLGRNVDADEYKKVIRLLAVWFGYPVEEKRRVEKKPARKERGHRLPPVTPNERAEIDDYLAEHPVPEINGDFGPLRYGEHSSEEWGSQ